MTRIAPTDPEKTGGYVRKVLDAQTQTWGAPLNNHLVYARSPALFKAVRGMWTGLNKAQLLDENLVALVNRRVAALNDCVF